MPVNFEEKFQSFGLDTSDEAPLRQAIIATNDPVKHLSLLYIYGYSFQKNERILRICDLYISNRVPGLTAVCMRVSIDYWRVVSEYLDVIEKFLNFDIYSEWYDEVIFSTNFVGRNLDSIDFPDTIQKKYEHLRSDPRYHQYVSA